MTVAELKQLLAEHNDSDKVLYFDSEAGEDIPLHENWLSFIGEDNG